MAPFSLGGARLNRTYGMSFGATIAALVMVFSAPPIGRADTVRQPLPFPSEYDYPLSVEAVQKLIDRGDESALRRHSWYLWAGINQPGYRDWPIWASWNSATQVFAPAPAASAGGAASGGQTAAQAAAKPALSLAAINKRNRANAPINLSAEAPIYIGASSLPDGQVFQSNGDIMLVTEAYSQQAYDWIRSNDLFERATLQKMQQKGDLNIPPAPHRAIVLKHMYWPVKKDGLSALPVVDMSHYEKPAVPDTTYVGFENQKRWSRAVAIDPSRATIPPGETASVTYLHDVLHPAAPNAQNPIPAPIGPITYSRAKVVSINDFYFKRLSKREFDAMSLADQRLINASFYWAYKRLFQDGDYLVAIASHIMTKEAPYWTLQSVWWSDEPNETPYAKDRPDIAKAVGPWRHYLLVTEDGTRKGATLPIAYNPYIELAAQHPVTTNCRNCHTRADTPNPAYITNHGPGALANLKPDDPIFRGELRMDFLWTIVDRAIPVPPQP